MLAVVVIVVVVIVAVVVTGFARGLAVTEWASIVLKESVV